MNEKKEKWNQQDQTAFKENIEIRGESQGG